jgi:hypothetical protein
MPIALSTDGQEKPPLCFNGMEQGRQAAAGELRIIANSPVWIKL